MPSGQPRGSEAEEYQWVHIDDFSPGVYDGSHVSTEQPTVSAPLGAANAVGTFACASIPGGALGPLPALTGTYSYPYSFPGSVTTLYILGLAVTPQLNDGDYEVVGVFEGDDGANHFVVAVSSVPALSANNVITGPGETVGTAGGFFGAPYPAFTRMTASGSGNPPPVLVFPTVVSTDTNGTSGHLWVYPTLAAPTTFTAQDLNTGHPSVVGQVITYGSRVLSLGGVNYSWPVSGGVNTNENINFTDPPLSATYGFQETLLGAEEPWGYGAWGSVSLGELLLIKKYGGAVILNGDIFAPSSVISVPGVESTGNIVGNAASTPTGLYYCSQNRGAWLWNGGNTSTKISKNIADDFFDMQTGVIQSNNFGFYCYHWQKWVMFSKNYIFDTESGAWWIIYPNAGTNVGHLTGRDIFWWQTTQNGSQVIGAPLAMTGANFTQYLSTFDNTVGSQSYQWTSLPIHVTKDADRVIDIREVTIRASDPASSGTGNVTVFVNGTNLGSYTGLSGGITVNPTILLLKSGVKGAQDITVKLLADNSATSQPAPIIHSVDIAYNIREQVKPNN